jgi:ComF family protein
MRHTDNDNLDGVVKSFSFINYLYAEIQVSKMFRRLLQTFKDSFFPRKCQACGHFFHLKNGNATGEKPLSHYIHDPIETSFYRVMAPFFCPSCITDFSPIRSPFCTQCGRMFESKSAANHQCGDCIQNKPVYHSIRSAGIYSGALKSAIHALKYRNKIQLSRPLGRLLFLSFMKYYDIKAIDTIIPIPLHVSRLKQRGFNQALILIREWPALCTAISPDRFAQIDFKSLVRSRKTLSQTGLGKDKRKQNVKGAFAVSDAAEISGKQILIIDDVYTTGSTCHECSKTLIRNGAKNVSVLTLARAD